jgi:hypothetical protein
VGSHMACVYLREIRIDKVEIKFYSQKTEKSHKKRYPSTLGYNLLHC